MALDLVPTGRDVPNDFNVIIEIPMNSEPVKYEVDKASGAIFVDRVLTTPMRYPCNYGYIPHTLSGDGDPADVLVIMPMPLIPGSVIRCRAVGMNGHVPKPINRAALLAAIARVVAENQSVAGLEAGSAAELPMPVA